MARRQNQIADALPLVAIDLGSDSVRAMAARRIAADLFQVLGVEERPQKYGNVCVEQGIITQSSNAGYVIAEVLKKRYGCASRSEERRVGQVRHGRCRSRVSPYQ